MRESSFNEAHPEFIGGPPSGVCSLLYIEDNPGDVALVRRAVEDLGFPVELNSVSNGEYALKYLRREPPYQGATRPDLILLDLSLPRRSGEDVLREIKLDYALKVIPVVVFSGAADSEMVYSVYESAANTCIRKPADADEYLSAIQQVCRYWLSLAVLPANQGR